MDVEFELDKNDYFNCIKELHKNKKSLFKTIFSNKLHILYVFFLCVIISTHIYYIQNNFLQIFFISLISMLLLAFFITAFNKKGYSRLIQNYNISYFGKSLHRKISFENDIFAIYSDKYVVTAHKSQIKNIIETENYYFCIIELGIGYLPFILAKKYITDNKFFKNFINQSKNNTRNIVSLKPMNQSYILFTLAIIFCFYKVYDFYTPNLNLGIGITKVPMIYNIQKDSVAEKVGLSREDIIVKVNGKHVLNYTPQKIIRYMYGKKPLILTVKNTYTGEINDIEVKI